MLSRRFTSAPVLFLGLFVMVTASGCAKRYEGSLKDDEAPPVRVAAATDQDRPALKWASLRKVRSAPAESPRKLAAVTPPPPPPAKAQEPCASSEMCAAQLRAMLNDQSRSWIGKPQTVDEHFTGTRQFAYLALVKVLKCQELATGLKDIQSAPTPAMSQAKYPVQVVMQIKELNAHVTNELTRESKARCAK